MGILDSFEKGLERAVNGAFAKTFRSGLQPVEVASALRSELDKRATTVTRDRILAPNSFTVAVHPTDAARMLEFGPALTDELVDVVRQHASKQGYTLTGAVSVQFAADEHVDVGTLRMTSQSTNVQVTWQPILDVDGARHPITEARTVIGRGSDADITLSDPGASRRHVEVQWDGERAFVRDLGSTNGSKLDGHPLTQAPLSSGQTITVGRSQIVFRLVPGGPARPSAPASRGQLFDYRAGGPS